LHRLSTSVFFSLSLFFGSTSFCEVGGNAKQSGFLLDEILDVITIGFLSYLKERTFEQLSQYRISQNLENENASITAQ